MCGRYTVTKEDRKFAKRYTIAVSDRVPFVPRYNICPTQTAPLIILQDDKPQLVDFRWGLIPSWAKDEKVMQINARGETVAEKPFFRSAFKKRRCLILADGFYEWKRAGTVKQPYWIYKKDQEVFPIAGLWECWPSPEGTELHTFSVITTGPNAVMEPIHDRMPVILTEEDCDTWLDPKTSSEQLKALLKPHNAEAMACHPVSPLVNSPRNIGPECVKAI